ncbi:MAG: YHS domain-containing (seleno)protein [Nitrospirota bacterium]
MKRMQRFVLAATIIFAVALSTQARAMDYSHSTPGLSGYDPVAYFTDGKPVRGSGFHVTVFNGVTYAFASAEHKKAFEAAPEKYLPVYGGYCAYGVAIGKKFVADPEVWKIVDGKLYLNLDRDIQRKWEKDVPGHINTANANWLKIKDKAPSDL